MERAESKTGTRRYRVRYAGYEDPSEDRWYDEEDLRKMGRETSALLDEFDEQEDKKVVLQRIAPKGAQVGVRRSESVARRVHIKGG